MQISSSIKIISHTDWKGVSWYINEHHNPHTYAGSVRLDCGIHLDKLTFNTSPHVLSEGVLHHFDSNASNAKSDYAFIMSNPILDMYVIFTSESGSETYTAASHSYFNRMLSKAENTSRNVMVYSHIVGGVYCETLFSPIAVGSDVVLESIIDVKYITSWILQQFVMEHVGFSCTSSCLENVLDMVSVFPTSSWSITCGMDNVLVSM